ncbi:MAG: hypothetical protein N3B12_00955 [Armatimonadetes bacterium]|nr:hypothetical protein [Armatimonadota bacterium]
MARGFLFWCVTGGTAFASLLTHLGNVDKLCCVVADYLFWLRNPIEIYRNNVDGLHEIWQTLARIPKTFF